MTESTLVISTKLNSYRAWNGVGPVEVLFGFYTENCKRHCDAMAALNEVYHAEDWCLDGSFEIVEAVDINDSDVDHELVSKVLSDINNAAEILAARSLSYAMAVKGNRAYLTIRIK